MTSVSGFCIVGTAHCFSGCEQDSQGMEDKPTRVTSHRDYHRGASVGAGKPLTHGQVNVPTEWIPKGVATEQGEGTPISVRIVGDVPHC